MTETEPTTTLRIRLLFSNQVLTKSQIKNGLKRSWLLVKPQHHQTISDVVSYILHSFDLFDSCPHGITLYLEGFVLPEFESTSILKDKDLITVKRKETRVIGAYKAVEDANTCIEDEIVEKQPIITRVRLLTNEKCVEDDEDEGEAENCKEDLVSKKRKVSNKLENSKKKRKREAVLDIPHKKHSDDCGLVTKPHKKRKHDNKTNQKALICSDVTEKRANDSEPESNSERCCSEDDVNKEDTIQASDMPAKAKKVSRNTLRKRSQSNFKRLHREMEEQRKKEQPVNDTTAFDEDSDEDGDLVPVEIRPGRIRYVPSGKVKEVQEANASNVNPTQNGTLEEQSKHNQVEKEANCWNGIVNKRKGQKWGQAKQTNSAWKETKNDDTHSSWDDRLKSTSSWKNSKDNGNSSSAWPAKKGQSSNSWADKKFNSNHKPVDFDKLIPLIDQPKVGDVVAYRLLELSSTWCPELSSFRVGKITSFEPESDKIVLIPVPEYPFNIEKKTFDNNVDEPPPGFSVYNEDGSLETDFPSLNDVRIVKLGDLTPSEATKIPTVNFFSAPSTSKTPVEELKNATTEFASKITQWLDTSVAGPSNSKKDTWEEIAEAEAAKKAKLTQDNWNKKQTPSNRPWSSRSFRGRGMAMARFRGGYQNGQ